MKNENEESSRRNFLKIGLLSSGAVIAGASIISAITKEESKETGKRVKVLTADGKLIEVDSSHILNGKFEDIAKREIRDGIDGRKFVMVIDLARCANERKCITGCQKMHFKQSPTEWIKVKKMQDTASTAPYWMPQPCFHCDNPPCTKVCPVDATFKRKDGIVLIDNDRCIGCRFCMAACPYNSRSFNWGENWGQSHEQAVASCNSHYTPETSTPSKMGTVEKCDFCPDMVKEGKLPDCVTSCPNGTIFYGDANEDTVSNGEETFRLSELIKNRAGYRFMEELGTEPRVYYLPPVKRNFPFEDDLEVHNTHE